MFFGEKKIGKKPCNVGGCNHYEPIGIRIFKHVFVNMFLQYYTGFYIEGDCFSQSSYYCMTKQGVFVYQVVLLRRQSF